MSNENKSNNKKSEGKSISIRKSFDSIPPQTGRLRNLFSEMQDQQARQQTESQQGSGGKKERSRRDDSTS